jgi:hypothetical protein
LLGPGFRWKPLIAFDLFCRLASALIRLASTANPSPPLLDPAAQDALEHATEKIDLPEAAVPVLGECGVIRHRPIQTEPTEPPVGRIEMNFIAQAPLRSNAEALTSQKHPDHQFGIDRGPADVTVERRQLLSDLFKVNESID